MTGRYFSTWPLLWDAQGELLDINIETQVGSMISLNHTIDKSGQSVYLRTVNRISSIEFVDKFSTCLFDWRSAGRQSSGACCCRNNIAAAEKRRRCDEELADACA